MNINNVKIRPIEIRDLLKVGNVIKRSKLPHLVKAGLSEKEIKEIYQKYSLKNLKAKIANSFYFIAETLDKGKIIGVIGLRKDDGSDVYNKLCMFFIDPKYQGMGIGRLLYEKIKETALEKGCEKMVVSSSPYAEPIYAHFGFKKVRVDWKEHANGGKSYTVWMEQDLTKQACVI